MAFKCLNGNLPTVGGYFIYRSKYGSIVKGTICAITHNKSSIESENGIIYSLNEIEVESVISIRLRKLLKI